MSRILVGCDNFVVKYVVTQESAENFLENGT